MLKCAHRVMRMPRPRSPRQSILSAFVLLTAAFRAPAQSAPADRGTPAACVRVAGPDITAPTPPPRDTGMRRIHTAGDTLPVAIRLLASVSAEEVRFARSPVVCVKLSGEAQLDSVHVLARRNLATPVVSGTTYRDVYVSVEILGRLNAECIAASITGVAPGDSAAGGRCASLQLQARRGATGTPP
jgi:hypothetical protein